MACRDSSAHRAEKIGSALGRRMLKPEHVGSTSVPCLPAKPIIDIVLVVADSADERGTRGRWRSPDINSVSGNRTGMNTEFSRARRTA
jgi:GrpB-like predicted nucleotidyltransferase (UPF0157 family)